MKRNKMDAHIQNVVSVLIVLLIGQDSHQTSGRTNQMRRDSRDILYLLYSETILYLYIL